MTVQIPRPYSQLAGKLGLRSWLRGKDCDLENLFCTIDDVVRSAEQRTSGQVNVTDWVLIALATVLDGDNRLFTHIDKAGYEIKNDDEWIRVLRAAAWTVLDMHEKEVEKGSWPKFDS